MTRLLIPRADQPQGVVRPDRLHFFGAECDYLWTPGNDGGKIPKVRTFNGLAGVPNAAFNTGTSRNLGLRPWCSVLVMMFPTATQSGTLFNAGNNTGGARLLVATGGSSIQLNWVASTVGTGTNQLVETGITAFNKIAGVLVTNWTAAGHTSWFKRPGKPVFTWSEGLAIVSPTDFSVVLSSAGTIGIELAAISSGVLNATQVRSLLENPWQIIEPLARNSRGRVAAGGSTTITTTVGNAAANGTTAAITRTIAATVGNAAADGTTANLIRVIATSTGNAAANGTIAAINRVIPTTTGNAVAGGITASIVTDSGATISCTVGNAVADGLIAGLIRTIATTTGNAIADGITATVTTVGQTTISCTLGNAIADGAMATVMRTITADPGNAVANGSIAELLRVIAAGPGNAAADGVTASILSSSVIVCMPGNAMASGITAAVTNVSGSDETYPLEGMTQALPLADINQSYPLAGVAQDYPI